MKFNLGFLPRFERQPLQFFDDFLGENVMEQLFVRHLVGIFNL